MLYSVRSCGSFVSSIKIESGGETTKTLFEELLDLI